MLKSFISKKYIQEFLWVVLGNTINILGVLIIIKLFTKQLSQEEYGIYYLSLTVSIFVNQIFFGPLGNSVSRYFLISLEKFTSEDLLSTSYLLGKKIVYILTIFLLLTLCILIKVDGYRFVILVISTYFYSIFTGISAIVSSLQNINRERKVVALFQILDAINKIIFTFIFINFFNKNANVVSIASTFSAFILLIFQIAYVVKNEGSLHFNRNVGMNKEWSKKLVNFSLPFSVWGVFTWAQISSDRWFLQKFSDTNSIAKYAVLFQIGYYPLTILMGYVVQTITPLLFHKAGDGFDPKMKADSTSLNLKVSVISILLSLIAFLFIYIFHDLIAVLLTSSKYYEISKYFPFMILSGGLFATSQILSLDFLSNLRINELMIIKITTSLVGIMLSYFFIKDLGFIGAIYSNFSFSLLYLITIFIIITYRFKKNNAKNLL